MDLTESERYYQNEWDLFERDTKRYQASLHTVAGLEIHHVLDIGCGAGQELLPFVQGLGANGSGVDISPDAIRVARARFEKLGLGNLVRFDCAPAEQLPFEAAAFDLVICRVVLPYTQNERLLSEVGRVLKPGGIFLLKIHHARFYLRRLVRGTLTRNLFAVHALRVLLAGSLYHLTGIQPGNRFTGSEVYQTRWKLKRVLQRHGLSIIGELDDSDSNPATPCFKIIKYPAL